MKTHPQRFFLITFTITWFFWWVIVISGLQISQMPAPLLFAIAGASPAISAVLLIYSSRDRKQIQDFWHRAFSFRRPGIKYLVISLFLAPLLLLAAGYSDKTLGGIGFSIDARFQVNIFNLIPFAVFTLFFGPLPEELGWRGYALDGLLSRFNALKSSLILGVIWTVWHLPLFFIQGSYQNSLPVGSAIFWLFLIDKLLQTILMTWIYQRSNRSTLTAILFHFAVNFSGEIISLTDRATLILIFFWILAALLAAITITRQEKRLSN
jgi:membrane protease YdiL (CAAX protease family)